MKHYCSFKALLFLLSIMLSSCASEAIDIQENQEIAVTLEAQSASCNYSLLGEMHNQGLDMILSFYNERGNWSYEEIFDSLDSFVLHLRDYINQTGGYSLTNNQMSAAIMIVKDNMGHLLESDIDSISYLLSAHGVPGETIDILIEAREILYLENQTMESAIGRIEDLEAQLAAEEKLTPLIAGSFGILKSSLCYWFNHYEDWGQIDYSSQSSNTLEVRSKFWDTINGMAEADFWSFCVGTVMGGPQTGVAAGCWGSAARGIRDVVTGNCC
jgi:hypothetical protein